MQNLNYTVKPTCNGKATKLISSVARRFRFIQVLEAWIFGALKIFG
jgi:hypothetical protein